ncbi:hypothetical protein RKE30_03045 [Streptomyces sp. Li-HN-5-11]|uniref:hypothetical protein n=1 Tax=Streptomyces sp. Li-HN-5-11 TaxID=3075432 RepID=UPI0028AC1268|nr:hypothetical protein [Streptomyces sp. Li-HN-5-11]WNM29439.1 hypothetical protein RKE30_03045 [Streptomyces sp. Li-HN-5-11]
MIHGYDGDALLLELEALSDAQCRAFAAACAESLLLCYGSTPAVSEGAGLAVCQQAVSLCWEVVERGIEVSGAVQPLLAELEEVLSDDEEGDLGVLEHVIAGAYYALQCSQEGDAGHAELTSKNLYEAADYLALSDGDIDLADSNSGREIIASDVVQGALSAITYIRDLVIVRAFRGDDCAADVSQVREFVARMGG